MNAVSLVSLSEKASGGFGVFCCGGFLCCCCVFGCFGLVFVVFVLPLLLCMPSSIFH